MSGRRRAILAAIGCAIGVAAIAISGGRPLVWALVLLVGASILLGVVVYSASRED